MSTTKNFKIGRSTNADCIHGCDVPIGDMFERQGSLHMRVNNRTTRGAKNPVDEITICNINTGAVWNVIDSEVYLIIRDCNISYRVQTP